MRVLVAGGRGYIGRKTVDALARVAGADVSVGTRTPRAPGEVALDLGDPSTFAAMDAFDVVVDCADGPGVDPSDALAHALATGTTFVTTNADAGVNERLVARHRDGAGGGARGDARGVAVAGVGLFPGVTNLMARALHAARPRCARLETAVRVSPLSGAGSGMCDLMVRMLATPAVRYEGSRRVEGPPVGAAVAMPFARGGGAHTARCAAFSEPVMVHRTTGVPDVAAYIALVPGVMGPAFAAMSALVPRGGRARRAYLAALAWQLRVMRGAVLRGRTSPVGLTAVADREGRSAKGAPALMAYTRDGQGATAYALAAAVARLGASRPRPGFYLPDEVFELRELVTTVNELARGDSPSIEITS